MLGLGEEGINHKENLLLSGLRMTEWVDMKLNYGSQNLTYEQKYNRNNTKIKKEQGGRKEIIWR